MKSNNLGSHVGTFNSTIDVYWKKRKDNKTKTRRAQGDVWYSYLGSSKELNDEEDNVTCVPILVFYTLSHQYTSTC